MPEKRRKNSQISSETKHKYFLFMGYHFTSITLKPKTNLLYTQVRWHNSMWVKLGVTGLAHVYECNANTDDRKHSQL